MEFKRGFLKTPKAKRMMEENSNPPVPDPSPKEKLPSPIDFHEVPACVRSQPDAQGDIKRRFVFRFWPRDPNGKPMGERKPDFRGKEAPNGLPIWGQDLYSFYRTQRMPDQPHHNTFSSGSLLAARMREFGELEAAALDIAWADKEEDPHEIFPCDVGQLIKDIESTDFIARPPPMLQKRLPFHLLPKKLIVHAPQGLLAVDSLAQEECDSEGEVVDKSPPPEVTYTYSLSLSTAGKKKMKEEEKAALEAEEKRKAEEAETWRPIMPVVDKSGPTEERLIYAKEPPCPSYPTSVEEAHLYVTFDNKFGVGNHSVVYNVSLDLPRRVLVEDQLCPTCFNEAAQSEIRRSRDEGEWELKPGEKQANFEITTVAVETGEMELSEPSDKEDEGKQREGDPGKDSSNPPRANNEHYIHITPKVENRTTGVYEGPIVYIYPKVEWQNEERGPLCKHLARPIGKNITRPTARVGVAAKLSRQHDRHLANESRNYQSFPEHFFHHWSGYNIIPPLHDPVPIGALVPQFYGYYVPDPPIQKADTGATADSRDYLSPIMLLESCGRPIDADELDIDDRQECMSLLLRLHAEGWLHGSVAERNILRQPGPISDWPLFRMGRERPVTSFRLIDFGRSTQGKEPLLERDGASKWLRLFHYRRMKRKPF